MNLPRPNLLRQELANIGVVYVVVLVVLAIALVYGLAPSSDVAVGVQNPPPATLGPTGGG